MALQQPFIKINKNIVIRENYIYVRAHTMKERNGISTLPSVRICLLPSSFEMTSWNPATFSIPFPREVFLLDYANWIKVHFVLPKIHTIYVLVKCMIVFCKNFMPRWWIMIIDSLLHDLRNDCLLVCLVTFARLALIKLVVAKTGIIFNKKEMTMKSFNSLTLLTWVAEFLICYS